MTTISTKTFSGKTFNLSKYSTHMSIWSPHTDEMNIVHHVGKPAYIKNLWNKIGSMSHKKELGIA